MNSSPASAPALDVNDLNFDTCERLRHIDWLLTQLGIDQKAPVLDAGGYPCYMARAYPQRRVVTADIYANGHPPYVKASGAALPFPDKAFDVTMACDVLEHVPPVHRESFLSELTRVSARAVIVAGPYTTPGAARAENMVRSLLPESSPAQIWLAEHAQCGLPSMDETLQVLSSGATDAEALPVGSLTEWVLWFAAQAAGERHHKVSEAMLHFISRYNRLHTAPEINFEAPAYRHAVIAALDSSTRDKLQQIMAGHDNANRHFNHDQVNEYVDSLGVLLQSIFKSNAAGAESATSIDSVTDEYISRLERMLSHRGMDLPQRNASADGKNPGHSSMPNRLRAAWQILRGK